MKNVLNQNAQNVQNTLKKGGLDCQVVVLPESTRTAVEAAMAISCQEAQIVKSLIFKTKSTEQPVLVLASGPNRVDEKVIQNYVGEKITKADAKYTKDITGFTIGGIPPVGHKTAIDWLFIDEDLMKHESVWAAAGTPHAVFNIKSQDLVSLTKAKVISIQKKGEAA